MIRICLGLGADIETSGFGLSLGIRAFLMRFWEIEALRSESRF